MAQNIGGRNTLIVGTAACAIFTLLSPLTFEKCDFTALVVTRALIGAAEGVMFPAASTLIAAWIPLKERSIAVSIVYSGVQFGSFIGTVGSGDLIATYGTGSTFYIYGFIAVIWCIASVS